MANDGKGAQSTQSSETELGQMREALGSNSPEIISASGDLAQQLNYEPFDTLQERGKAARSKIEVEVGFGESDRHMTNAFMGFNHRMSALAMPKNREQTYLTFFTRPDMNFSRNNLTQSRRMSDMANSHISSANMSIIAALDPLNEIVADDDTYIRLGGPLKSGIPFDNKQAFIPILSNALVSISGFPDNTLDVYTSSEGIQREQFSMVDSVYNIYNSFTVSASFRNLDGDPITTLFSAWLEYMSNVYLGNMMPRGRNIAENDIDYQTRIYRINTDPSMRYVTKIGIANAAFPLNDNLGAAMNVDMANPFITETDTVNVQFQAVGASYNDPILIDEFNQAVWTFNHDMMPTPGEEDFIPQGSNMMRLMPDEVQFFNYRAYPHISPKTREISWYVDEEVYVNIREEVVGL